LGKGSFEKQLQQFSQNPEENFSGMEKKIPQPGGKKRWQGKQNPGRGKTTCKLGMEKVQNAKRGGKQKRKGRKKLETGILVLREKRRPNEREKK